MGVGGWGSVGRRESHASQGRGEALRAKVCRTQQASGLHREGSLLGEKLEKGWETPVGLKKRREISRPEIEGANVDFLPVRLAVSKDFNIWDAWKGLDTGEPGTSENIEDVFTTRKPREKYAGPGISVG